MKVKDLISQFLEVELELDSGCHIDVNHFSSIFNLKLTTRTLNCLYSAGLFFLGDVIRCDESVFLRLPNFGSKSFKEIINKLNEMQLNINFTFSKAENDMYFSLRALFLKKVKELLFFIAYIKGQQAKKEFIDLLKFKNEDVNNRIEHISIMSEKPTK